MNKIFLLFIYLIVFQSVSAQKDQAADQQPKMDWWGDKDGMLNEQARLSLQMASDVLKKYQPAVDESPEREMALLLIDNVLHDEKANLRPAVQDFFIERYENTIREIHDLKVENGVVIWKLYNHSFVVKTPSVTIGFDIQRSFEGKDGYILKKKVVRELIDQVDILFVTHRHADHSDEWVAETFIEQNKPVITPPDMWPDSKVYKFVLHPERKIDFVQEINLPAKGIKIKAVIYPGHQGKNIPDNVYLVFTPEGVTLAHTGDQSNQEDFSWIDKVGDKFKVDVLMVNAWTVSPDLRLPKGFRPKLIIPGHENELGHTVDHREPYWLNPVRFGNFRTLPWVELFWGEKYSYHPATERK